MVTRLAVRETTLATNGNPISVLESPVKMGQFSPGVRSTLKLIVPKRAEAPDVANRAMRLAHR